MKAYIIIAILYGLYSLMMQYLRHPMFCHFKTMAIVFFFNTIFMPFSIVYAAVKNHLIPWNLLKGLKDQGPFGRAFRNFFITGNAWGLLHINSHIRQDTKKPKVSYKTKMSALRASESMEKKNNVHYSIYKCVFCDGYHIGRNRDNK